jgi:hypothetical protein
LSTYTPTIFFASVPPANEGATRHMSARNTRALAIRLARMKKTAAWIILLPLVLFIDPEMVYRYYIFIIGPELVGFY